MKQAWTILAENTNASSKLTEQLGVSSLVSQLLINRGFHDVTAAKHFLDISLRDIHDPFLLCDMEKAVQVLLQAIDEQDPITVYGDYDVDGITSTTLLLGVLESLGAHVDYYIPHRLQEGYGLNAEAIKTIARRGAKFIITVDCGINAVEEVELARELGMEIVITDHHEPDQLLPRATAIINPKRCDCGYPFKGLAGVGVAFKLAQALLSRVYGQKEHELLGMEWLDLVALGTVADIVPLLGENRIFVKEGLKVLNRDNRVGIKALREKAGWSTRPLTEEAIGYYLGPRLNSAGRMDSAEWGVKLLTTQDANEADRIGNELNHLNTLRQETCEKIFAEAMLMVQDQVDLDREKIIILAAPGWHHGTIGIVASRLQEHFYRPVILLCQEGDICRGSARSIRGFHLFEALHECQEWLQRFGGHELAAGLTLKTNNLQAFRAAMNELADHWLTETDLVPVLRIDAPIDIKQIDLSLVEEIQNLGPFGEANPVPAFVAQDIVPDRILPIGGGKHLKIITSGIEGIGFGFGDRISAIQEAAALDIAFSLSINEWNGMLKPQIQLIDFKDNSTFIDTLFRREQSGENTTAYASIQESAQFYTKVAGVTFEGRQAVIAGLSEGEELVLKREPDNPHDSYAIAVETRAANSIGYLKRYLAKHLSPLMDEGQGYRAYVSQITGGADRNYGVNLYIEKVIPLKEAEPVSCEVLKNQYKGLTEGEVWETIRKAVLGDDYPFHDKQIEALQSLSGKENTLVILGTGRGKSAIFQSFAAYKALKHNEMTVILYPLRALINDQYENLVEKLSPFGIRIEKGMGSVTEGEKVKLLTRLQEGEVDILLTTPEFAQYHCHSIFTGRKPGFLVVDEAHHVGEAHRPAYQRLGYLQQCFGYPVTLGVSATVNNETARQLIQQLQINKVIIDPHIRTNLCVMDQRNCEDKKAYLRDILARGEKTIIYVNSRRQAYELASDLRISTGNPIAFYHGGLNAKDRAILEKMFREGEITGMVSTSAFGEGINISDVRHVVLYHLNFSFTEFNQQSGRAGRDGKEASIHLLAGNDDAAINEFILDAKVPSREVLGQLYCVLKQLCKKEQYVGLTNDELVQLVEQYVSIKISESMISGALGILEELGIIYREGRGLGRYIGMNGDHEKTLDLMDSLRYLEGLQEKKEFLDFKQNYLSLPKTQLLRLINQPIYPDENFIYELE